MLTWWQSSVRWILFWVKLIGKLQMTKTLIQSCFLLLTFAGQVAVSYSQPTQCDLNIQIFDIYGSGLLDNVNVKLINFETRKQIKAIKFSETFVFSGLSSGIYQIELNKKDYKKKIKKFSVDCSFVDDSNKIFENVFLLKGSNKEVINLDSTGIKDSLVVSDSENPANTKSIQVVAGNNDKPINKSAMKLVKPIYPGAARAVRASGRVNVQITIDEDGNVIKAEAIDGHAFLKNAAIKAVRLSKFSPTLLSENPVKVTGVMVYNFTPQ